MRSPVLVTVTLMLTLSPILTSAGDTVRSLVVRAAGRVEAMTVKAVK